MRPWLTVLTTPRRRDYLAATVASMVVAGAMALDYERIIFVDGPADNYSNFPGWRICQLAPKPLGVRYACFRILESAAHAGAESIIYCEDDVNYCANALTAIAAIRVPEQASFVSFCDIKHSAYKAGFAVAPGYDWNAVENQGGHWGNQCVKIPGRSLAKLIQNESPFQDWKIASDCVLGMVLGDYATFNPSLAQHTGAVSTVQDMMNGRIPFEGRGRLAASYPGDSFDALSLAGKPAPVYAAELMTIPLCNLHNERHPDGRTCGQ